MLRWWLDRKKRQQIDEFVLSLSGSASKEVVEAFRCPWCDGKIEISAHPEKKRRVHLSCSVDPAHYARHVGLHHDRAEWWDKYTENGVWYD